jgi:hypothetical protein
VTAPLTVNVAGWLIDRLRDTFGADHVDGLTPSDLKAHVPFIRVMRLGGTNDGFLLDAANVAFHCFAANQKAADDLAGSVVRAVTDLRGHPASGAVLTLPRTLSGPSWADVADQNLAHSVVLMQTRIQTTS